MDQSGQIFAICRVGDVASNRAVGFVLVRLDEQGHKVPWPVIIVRKDKHIYGYVNRCPHQGLALDFEPQQFLDSSLSHLVCGKHGSQFEIATGLCFDGPCKGEHLEPIDLLIDEGDLCVRGIQLAEEDGLDLVEEDEHPEVMITSD
jgi:nitrite reductase/ring-hydroxylating ferredoxin subunit